MSSIAGIRNRSPVAYPTSSERGGVTSIAPPLTRTRYIDGTQSPAAPNGAIGNPYPSVQAWLGDQNVFPLSGPTSQADANTAQVALISPTPEAEWPSTPWVFPPGRNLSIVALQPPGADGVTFAQPISWANDNVANPPYYSVLTLSGLTVYPPQPFVITDSDSYPSYLQLYGTATFGLPSSFYSFSTFDYSGASLFQGVLVQGEKTILYVASLVPNTSAYAELIVLAGATYSFGDNETWQQMTCEGGSIGGPELNQAGTEISYFSNASIGFSALAFAQPNSSVVFADGCTFTQALAINPGNVAGLMAIWDSDSWISFVAQGGTYNADDVMLVDGGYKAGVVPGGNCNATGTICLAGAAGGAAGTGAREGGGNSYGLLGSGSAYAVTILHAYAEAGNTIEVYVVPGTVLTYPVTIYDQGGGPIAKFEAGNSGAYAVFRYSETGTWLWLEGTQET